MDNRTLTMATLAALGPYAMQCDVGAAVGSSDATKGRIKRRGKGGGGFVVASSPITPGSGKGKIGRNVKCPCGSGRKYKKCCLVKTKHVPPTLRAREHEPAVKIVNGKDPTAISLMRAGVSPAIVYAYLKTGEYITEATVSLRTEEEATAWHAAIEEYDNASSEDKILMLEPAIDE